MCGLRYRSQLFDIFIGELSTLDESAERITLPHRSRRRPGEQVIEECHAATLKLGFLR